MEKTTKKNRNVDFAKNTIILFIGKFATQFMSLLLLPLYTRYLITEEYGRIDLIQTYIALFVPILSLRVDSAIFRFLVDKRNNDEEKQRIITNISLIAFLGVFITLIICVSLSFFVKIKYFKYVVVNLIVLMISNILLQLLRGIGKNFQYSIASIITGAITLLCNLVLILNLKMGAESILISSTLANVICIIFIVINTKYFNFIKLKKIEKNTLKETLAYSFPMIPNSLSWWIVNVSDRTIISSSLGTAFNGIYTVSCKFSNILNSIFSIFSMAWQETATLHINDEDKDAFFSEMINNILMLFSTVALLILVALPIFYNIIIGNNYISSYEYIPILLYANTWNVLIGLIGGIYVAKKRTKEIANTTIVSAIINIIINFILIRYIGLYAACISTLLSYFIMGIYRYFDCKKYVNVKLKFKSIILYTIFFAISSYFYLKKIFFMNLLNICFVFIYSILVNKNILVYIFKFTRRKNKKMKG